jgi:hypothetical protein
MKISFPEDRLPVGIIRINRVDASELVITSALMVARWRSPFAIDTF